jgi:CIC family chloride channel protein
MPRLSRSLGVGVLLPALIGVATGAGVAGLSALAEGLALPHLAALPGLWPAAFSPLALLVTLAVVRFVTRASRPATTELYIETYHEPGATLPLRQLPGRLLAGLTTVGFGGSQGLESPSALLGASLGQLLGAARGVALDAAERRTLFMAGAGAGIAAVFSSPGVGALYGMEVPWRRDVDAPRLVPCAVAAACAYGVRSALVGPSHLVTLDAVPPLDVAFVGGAVGVALAAGVVARLFATATSAAHALARRGSAVSRASFGGATLALLAAAGYLGTGSWITFGPGYVAADWLFSAPHAVALLAAALLVRTAGTLVCVYGGGGGGVFTSLACTGAFTGQIVAQLLGRTDDAYALLGAACVLGSAYHIPLAAMLYVAESGGGVGLSMLGLGAVALSQALVGDASVSDAQRDARDAA